MMQALRSLDQTWPTRRLWVGVLLALALNTLASAWLNASYAASGFPVPYYEAQLSFDAVKIKGWYTQLLQAGRLQLYVQTQHIDFVFIVSVALLHPLALLLVGRLFSATSTARRWLRGAAALSVVAPVADALENAVSYVMLANPVGFHPLWAGLYSSFAALKFVMFAGAYGAVLVAMGAWLVQWVMRRAGPRPARGA